MSIHQTAALLSSEPLFVFISVFVFFLSNWVLGNYSCGSHRNHIAFRPRRRLTMILPNDIVEDLTSKRGAHLPTVSINIPRVLQDHADGTVARLNTELDAMAGRMAQLVLERAVVETHQLIQRALKDRIDPLK
jgi:hypothetical protein